MKVSVCRPTDLSRADIDRWNELRGSDPDLDNPVFSPGYTLAVSSVRSDVWVAVVEQDGGIAGFFPYQRKAFRNGFPVGGPLCDLQGLVSEPGLRCEAAELLKRTGLRTYRFDHLAAAQRVFLPHARKTFASRSIDLTHGFEAYAASRRSDGSEQIRKVEALARKLGRTVGPIRFEVADGNAAALRQLLAWKSAQYLRSGLVDAFSYGWMVELLERLFVTRDPEFAGILSTLSVGDRAIAAHMGIRSEAVWHYWVTAYDPAFRHYSPGLILLTEMAQAAPSLGLRRIDLGKGDEPYKRRFANRVGQVAEGRAEVSAGGWRDVVVERLEKAVRELPPRGIAGWSKRFIERQRTRISYR